ncbi:MAG: hypothetical protein SGJ19_07120 [Planctomycetia bacterium]|nr:hypothetical protein [Planctomycetia bacterium]
MNGSANVGSIAALDRFRADLLRFAQASGQTLEEVQAEANRFVDWLEHEQTAFWKQELRRCEAKVAEAKVDLLRARAATIDPEHTPSCLQERKVLEAAQRRLVATEEKLQRVRRWIPVVRQAVDDYRMQMAAFVNSLTCDVPRAVSRLRQLAERLHEYAAVAIPTGNAGQVSASMAQVRDTPDSEGATT